MSQSHESPEPQYKIDELSRKANRKGFACGNTALDEYFRTRVGQDMDKGYCACFAATADDGSLAGFYTLAACAISLDEIPDDLKLKMARYPTVPCTLMGRLAVATEHQGRGLGAALLYDAWSRAGNEKLGGVGLFVEAKDERAQAFYEKYGFIKLEKELSLWLPLKGTAPLSGHS